MRVAFINAGGSLAAESWLPLESLAAYESDVAALGRQRAILTGETKEWLDQ